MQSWQFTPDEVREAFTADQTTKILGCSRTTLWRITKSGDLAYVNTGSGRGQPRYPSRAIDAYVLARSHGQQTAPD